MPDNFNLIGQTHTFPATAFGATPPPFVEVHFNNTGNRTIASVNIRATGDIGAFVFPIPDFTSLVGFTYPWSAAPGALVVAMRITPASGLAVGTYTITVTVTGTGGISETFDVSITVTNPVTGVAIQQQPQLSYIYGESLNLSALVARLTFADSTTQDVSFADLAAEGLTASPDDGAQLNLTHNNTPITVTHTASGLSATTNNLTVANPVTGIAVTTQPTNLVYTVVEELDLAGLVVTLTFTNGTTQAVPFAQFGTYGLVTNPEQDATLTISAHNNQPVVITHTASGQQANTNNLTVTDPITSVVVSVQPPNLSYAAGDILNLAGLFVRLYRISGGFVAWPHNLFGEPTAGFITYPAAGTILTAAHDGVGVGVRITHTPTGLYVYTNPLEVSAFGISLTSTDPRFTNGVIDFGSVGIGYAPVNPVTVTITNTGNRASGAIQISAVNGSLADFVFDPANIAAIPVGQTATFTVRPANGLQIDTHELTVSVGNANASANLELEFLVTPAAHTMRVVNRNNPDGGNIHPDSYVEQNVFYGEWVHILLQDMSPDFLFESVSVSRNGIALTPAEIDAFLYTALPSGAIVTHTIDMNTAAFTPLTIRAERFCQIDGDIEIVFYFDTARSVTVDTGIDGDIDPQYQRIHGWYRDGSNVNISAANGTGRRWAGWEATVGLMPNPSNAITNFTMPHNAVTITETWLTIVDALVVTGGTLSNPAFAIYNNHAFGDTITINANIPTDRSFIRWEVLQGGVTLNNPMADETTFILGASNVEIQAVYSSAVTVTFNPGGGEVSPSNATTGTNGRLASLPIPTRAGNWRFDGWFTAAIGGTEVTTSTVFETATTIFAHWTDTTLPTVILNPTAITINDAALTATSTVSGTATGVITLNTANLPQGVTAAVNQATGAITVTGVRPAAGQAIINGAFYVIVTRQGNSQTLMVNVNLTALPAGQHSVTVTTQGNGTASTNPTSAAQGATINLTATANAGYTFARWEVVSGGVTIANSQSANTNFVMPNNAVTVRAVFETTIAQPTVTAVSVSPSTANVQRGTTRQFSATVQGTNNPPQTVTWSVTGHGGASINQSGVLSVAANVPANTVLTVRATSTHDTNVSGTATVTVTVPGGDNQGGNGNNQDGGNNQGGGNQDGNNQSGNNQGGGNQGNNNQGNQPQPPAIGRPEDEYSTEPDDDTPPTPGPDPDTDPADIHEPRLLAAPAPGERVEWIIPTPQPILPAHQLFIDVAAGAWYHDFITSVVSHGLFSGMGDDTFNPQGTMTRAMFAQVAANLQGVDISAFAGGTRFTDVAPDVWYNAAVEWAAYMGIVSGVGNNRFDPSAPITREQMAAMLRRFITVMEVGIPILDPDEIIPFTDQDNISAWAVHSVEFIQATGIIGGFPDGRFAPQATATRAEVATIFARFLEVLSSQ